MAVVEMVAIVFALNEFSILWGEKRYFIKAVSHKPQLQKITTEDGLIPSDQKELCKERTLAQ